MKLQNIAICLIMTTSLGQVMNADDVFIPSVIPTTATPRSTNKPVAGIRSNINQDVKNAEQAVKEAVFKSMIAELNNKLDALDTKLDAIAEKLDVNFLVTKTDPFLSEDEQS